MARRERFRGPNGYFLNRESAIASGNYIRELYEDGRKIHTERVQTEGQQVGGGAPGRAFLSDEPTPTATSFFPNWDDEENQYATIRHANGQSLTPDAFDDPPDDAEGFQVRFIVPSSPEYPRGWASYSALGMDQWQHVDSVLDDGRAKGATGVGAIVFYRHMPV